VDAKFKQAILMETGTIDIEHESRPDARAKRHSVSGNLLAQSKASNGRAQICLASAEVRETAKNLRELLLCDLREEGYTLGEIGKLFGITRQRVSQIERKMVRRAAVRCYDKTGHGRLRSRSNPIRNLYEMRIRRITREEFESRLDSINRFYEPQFENILKRRYKRPGFLDTGSGASEITDFWKLWPLIELYHGTPFTFSKLLGDFPQLTKQSHLPQLLCRLRRTGLLQKVGVVNVKGHNHPEVLMAEAPIEQHVTATIERLVASWSRKLQRLRSAYRPTRPTRSIELTRQCLLERLIGEGVPSDEIEKVLGRRNRRL
jgi:hypothetical protein